MFLEDILKLKDGWYNQGGKAPKLNSMALRLLENYPVDLIPPVITPTPEGNLLLEWRTAGDPSVDLDLTTLTARYHSFNGDEADIEQSFDLSDENAWDGFYKFLLINIKKMMSAKQGWQIGGEIRAKYPKDLTRAMMDEIIKKWDCSTSRPEMFLFAACNNPNGEYNISELELYWRFKIAVRKYQLTQNQECLSPRMQKQIGKIMMVELENMINSSTADTQSLLRRILHDTLEMWYNSAKDFAAQAEGVKSIFKIKDQVREKYPMYNSKGFTTEAHQIIKDCISEKLSD